MPGVMSTGCQKRSGQSTVWDSENPQACDADADEKEDAPGADEETEEEEPSAAPCWSSEDENSEEDDASEAADDVASNDAEASLATEETEDAEVTGADETLDGAADDAGTLLRGTDERGTDDLGGLSPPPPDVPGAEDAGADDAGTLLDAGAGGSLVMVKLLLWSGASWRQDTSPCIWKFVEPWFTPAALPGPVSWSMNVVLCAAIAAPVRAQNPVAARSSEREVPMTERLRVMG
jgi:hypothetical protein